MENRNLKELLSDACGNQRNMTQFAKECGVSATTLYRIASGQIRRRVSTRILEQIVKNAAPNSGVSVSELQHACDRAIESSYIHNPHPVTTYDLRVEAYAEQIIKQQMFETYSDVGVYAVEPKLRMWDFGLFPKGTRESEKLILYKVSNMKDAKSIEMVINEIYFLIGQWVCSNRADLPENKSIFYKIVLVTDDDDLLSQIREKFNDVNIEGENIYIICINRKTNKITEHSLSERQQPPNNEDKEERVWTVKLNT